MKHNKFLALLLSLLVLMALACSISTSSTAPQPTSDIQGTINAAVAITETAQGNVQATSDTGPLATDTPPPPAATEIPATPTTEQEAQPSPTLGQAATAPAAITITDWSMQYFVPLTSGCKVKGASCWKSDDDYSKHFGGQMFLTSRNGVFLDPAWPRPYLVFWHKHDLKRAASLEIRVNDDWMIVRDFTRSYGDWGQVYIDLSDYKGKEIGVRFSSDGAYGDWGSYPRSMWFIQEVKVVPDFTP